MLDLVNLPIPVILFLILVAIVLQLVRRIWFGAEATNVSVLRDLLIMLKDVVRPVFDVVDSPEESPETGSICRQAVVLPAWRIDL